MRTPAEEARFQELSAYYGLNTPPPAPEENYGTWGFAGRTAANFFPGALEKLINMPEGILNLGVPKEVQVPLTKVPNFFDVRAPEGIGEHIIGGAGEIAEYLPTIIGTEMAAASGLARLGMTAPRAVEFGGTMLRGAARPSNTARIAASAIGMGLPMAPHGAETTAVMGTTGAAQTAANVLGMGWRGRLATGLFGGGLGYYEGSKGEHGTPTQGAIMAGLNFLGPTMIDPIVNKFTGFKPRPGGEPVPGQPYRVPDNVNIYGRGNEYDVFAGLQRPPRGTIATEPPLPPPPAPSEFQLNRGYQPPQPGGIPFYEVPDPMDLRLVGTNTEGGGR